MKNALAKRALRFVAVSLTLFTLMLVFAPREPFAKFFRGLCNLTYERCGDDRTARFLPFEDPKQQFDSRMEIGIYSRQFYGMGLPFSAYRDGYIPIALFIALTLATPTSWRRRSKALAGGLPLLLLFTVGRIGLSLANGFAKAPVAGRLLWSADPELVTLIARLEQLLLIDPITSYIAPFLLWVVLTVRHEDLVRENIKE